MRVIRHSSFLIECSLDTRHIDGGRRRSRHACSIGGPNGGAGEWEEELGSYLSVDSASLLKLTIRGRSIYKAGERGVGRRKEIKSYTSRPPRPGLTKFLVLKMCPLEHIV